MGKFGSDPNVRLFERILLTVHGTPNPLITPITEKCLQNLNYDGNKAIHGQESPLAALKHVDAVTQPELDQVVGH